jgi:EF-P beta-lysylation protein EpmB
MIPVTPFERQAPSWQRELADAVTDPGELVSMLGLDPALAQPARRAMETSGFRLRVPRAFVARMRHRDPGDPLLRQVLPLEDELREHPLFTPDPLAERAARRAPGLLQKYQGRALLVTTGACAVHCRYCFRREYPYADEVEGDSRWRAALEAIAADTSLEEVILSGGDPLSLSNARLAGLTAALARIPHVRRLRLHTREPVVLPSRVDAGLLGWLAKLPWPTVIVLHVNHPAEIDDEVRAACARLRATGLLLLNQTVLLKGVNDRADTLAELSRVLFDAGVLPYYLHLLDRVRGATHFEVAESTACELASSLTARLPGYLVPRLVREMPEATAKVPMRIDIPRASRGPSGEACQVPTGR